MGIIDDAKAVYEANFQMTTQFERALFLSWYCSKGDCAFCYMSTQNTGPIARRTKESVYAETIISHACGWGIEFLSGGYDSFDIKELVDIAKNVSMITKKKQWLNIGALRKNELEAFIPYIKGYVGTLECANPKLRKKICPSKPLGDIEKTYSLCDELGLEKSATIIIGLGETMDDFEWFARFIRRNNITRVTFYSLNPQKGTIFTSSPKIGYYEEWIARTRVAFPDIWITAGAWYDKTDYFSRLLIAGANNFTKFPALKYFNTRYAKDIESEIRKAGRELIGTLTKKPVIDFDLSVFGKSKEKVRKKLEQYMKKLK